MTRRGFSDIQRLQLGNQLLADDVIDRGSLSFAGVNQPMPGHSASGCVLVSAVVFAG